MAVHEVSSEEGTPVDPDPAPAAGPLARIGRASATVAVVGPVAYVVLTLVLGAAWDGYDAVRQTQSELGAVDSPVRAWMNVVGFGGIGVSILAFAVAYHVCLRRSGARWVAVALLAVAGVGMTTVAFLPCDPGCVDVTSTGRLHSLFSAPGAIGLPSAAMVSALAFHRDGRLDRRWQSWSFWLGLASLSSGPVVAVGLVDEVDGLLQRAGMWTSLLWMAVVAARLRRLGTTPTDASG